MAVLSFDQVLTSGVTSLTALTPDALGYVLPPPTFSLGASPVYYNVLTNATYAGSVEICFTYSNNSFAAGVMPLLLHYENSVWQDTTSSSDPANSILCGNVTSLSPFAVGTYISNTTSEPTVVPTSSPSR